MKKIFLMLVAICAFAACDPTHEKINNGGHITIDELKAKTTVTVDQAPSGKNGNVITCIITFTFFDKFSCCDQKGSQQRC